MYLAVIDRLANAWSALKPRAEAQTPPAAARKPMRLANPRLLAGSPDDVFVLRASKSCELTSWLDGRRFTRAAAIPLPMPGCSIVGCACRYEPVANLRRGERRTDSERRDAVRFEATSDRRSIGADRRDRDAWRGNEPR